MCVAAAIVAPGCLVTSCWGSALSGPMRRALITSSLRQKRSACVTANCTSSSRAATLRMMKGCRPRALQPKMVPRPHQFQVPRSVQSRSERVLQPPSASSLVTALVVWVSAPHASARRDISDEPSSAGVAAARLEEPQAQCARSKERGDARFRSATSSARADRASDPAEPATVICGGASSRPRHDSQLAWRCAKASAARRAAA